MDTMTFVLFGGTGDLAKRKIYPALYNLFLEEKMPSTFSIIGLGRNESTDKDFQESVENSIRTFSRRLSDNGSKIEQFLTTIRYSKLDARNKEDYQRLLQLVKDREEELNIPENRLFYLSVAPEFFDVIALNIKESGLGTTNGWKRLIIEKPFGQDLKSARLLNQNLNNAFKEDEIYRIDHYLGKPMVRNLEALKFENPVFQALWSNRSIANVQITASETVGVEQRAGYYDQAGAIRDMFQNHMLQLLMMTAMHAPKQKDANEIRAEKRKVLEALRPLNKDEVGKNLVRGQYEAGLVNNKNVPGYRDEPGVRKDSQTDTFIAARLWIDNQDWAGVPFYIRTGKKMPEKSTRIVVEFKRNHNDIYLNKDPNLLVIEINPNESVSLILNSKNPVNGELEPINADYASSQLDVPDGYELLIYDAIRGDSRFFAHWNEVELSWKWVQPILEAFDEEQIPLHGYTAGSNGPDAANRLLEEDGFSWWLDKSSIKEKQLALQA
ncbi:glucose-6-phosphate dehydrogenase [Oceanobacillus piezotolerans]|uniref:Glucose-6-phosphate 1-dehydrogenase n=1 Tax=Oceanobacillus piezotolerans TaxID=2448030 RepID=A0A498D2Y4_9BACI|nr:glucose-6-phosphate dehydrogenase [Oceanobacillus piezotolerans]RLL41346.1 glucose-6-phosphate dehydrogenase [Oceanobacillus piezotolerans]